MANSRKKSYILNKNIRKSRRVKRKYHLQKGGAINKGKVSITLPTTADATADATAATVGLLLKTTNSVIPYTRTVDKVEFPFNIASAVVVKLNEGNVYIIKIADNKNDYVINNNIQLYNNAKPLHEAFSIFVEDYSVNQKGSRIFDMHNSLKMLHIPSLKFREYVYFDLAEIKKIRDSATDSVSYDKINDFIGLKSTITSKVMKLPTGKSILPEKKEDGTESPAVQTVNDANADIPFSEGYNNFVPEELIPLFNENETHNTIRNNKDLLISYIDIIAEINGLFKEVIDYNYKDKLKDFIYDTLKDSNIEPIAHIFNKRESLDKANTELKNRLKGEVIGKFTFFLNAVNKKMYVAPPPPSEEAIAAMKTVRENALTVEKHKEKAVEILSLLENALIKKQDKERTELLKVINLQQPNATDIELAKKAILAIINEKNDLDVAQREAATVWKNMTPLQIHEMTDTANQMIDTVEKVNQVILRAKKILDRVNQEAAATEPDANTDPNPNTMTEANNKWRRAAAKVKAAVALAPPPLAPPPPPPSRLSTNGENSEDEDYEEAATEAAATAENHKEKAVEISALLRRAIITNQDKDMNYLHEVLNLETKLSKPELAANAIAAIKNEMDKASEAGNAVTNALKNMKQNTDNHVTAMKAKDAIKKSIDAYNKGKAAVVGPWAATEPDVNTDPNPNTMAPPPPLPPSTPPPPDEDTRLSTFGEMVVVRAEALRGAKEAAAQAVVMAEAAEEKARNDAEAAEDATKPVEKLDTEHAARDAAKRFREASDAELAARQVVELAKEVKEWANNPKATSTLQTWREGVNKVIEELNKKVDGKNRMPLREPAMGQTRSIADRTMFELRVSNNVKTLVKKLNNWVVNTRSPPIATGAPPPPPLSPSPPPLPPANRNASQKFEDVNHDDGTNGKGSMAFTAVMNARQAKNNVLAAKKKVDQISLLLEKFINNVTADAWEQLNRQLNIKMGLQPSVPQLVNNAIKDINDTVQQAKKALSEAKMAAKAAKEAMGAAAVPPNMANWVKAAMEAEAEAEVAAAAAAARAEKVVNAAKAKMEIKAANNRLWRAKADRAREAAGRAAGRAAAAKEAAEKEAAARAAAAKARAAKEAVAESAEAWMAATKAKVAAKNASPEAAEAANKAKEAAKEAAKKAAASPAAKKAVDRMAAAVEEKRREAKEKAEKKTEERGLQVGPSPMSAAKAAAAKAADVARAAAARAAEAGAVERVAKEEAMAAVGTAAKEAAARAVEKAVDEARKARAAAQAARDDERLAKAMYGGAPPQFQYKIISITPERALDLYEKADSILEKLLKFMTECANKINLNLTFIKSGVVPEKDHVIQSFQIDYFQELLRENYTLANLGIKMYGALYKCFNILWQFSIDAGEKDKLVTNYVNFDANIKPLFEDIAEADSRGKLQTTLTANTGSTMGQPITMFRNRVSTNDKLRERLEQQMRKKGVTPQDRNSESGASYNDDDEDKTARRAAGKAVGKAVVAVGKVVGKAPLLAAKMVTKKAKAAVAAVAAAKEAAAEEAARKKAEEAARKKAQVTAGLVTAGMIAMGGKAANTKSKTPAAVQRIQTQHLGGAADIKDDPPDFSKLTKGSEIIFQHLPIVLYGMCYFIYSKEHMRAIQSDKILDNMKKKYYIADKYYLQLFACMMGESNKLSYLCPKHEYSDKGSRREVFKELHKGAELSELTGEELTGGELTGGAPNDILSGMEELMQYLNGKRGKTVRVSEKPQILKDLNVITTLQEWWKKSPDEYKSPKRGSLPNKYIIKTESELKDIVREHEKDFFISKNDFHDGIAKYEEKYTDTLYQQAEKLLTKQPPKDADGIRESIIKVNSLIDNIENIKEEKHPGLETENERKSMLQKLEKRRQILVINMENAEARQAGIKSGFVRGHGRGASAAEIRRLQEQLNIMGKKLQRVIDHKEVERIKDGQNKINVELIIPKGVETGVTTRPQKGVDGQVFAQLQTFMHTIEKEQINTIDKEFIAGTVHKANDKFDKIPGELKDHLRYFLENIFENPTGEEIDIEKCLETTNIEEACKKYTVNETKLDANVKNVVKHVKQLIITYKDIDSTVADISQTSKKFRDSLYQMFQHLSSHTQPGGDMAGGGAEFLINKPIIIGINEEKSYEEAKTKINANQDTLKNAKIAANDEYFKEQFGIEDDDATATAKAAADAAAKAANDDAAKAAKAADDAAKAYAAAKADADAKAAAEEKAAAEKKAKEAEERADNERAAAAGAAVWEADANAYAKAAAKADDDAAKAAVDATKAAAKADAKAATKADADAAKADADTKADAAKADADAKADAAKPPLVPPPATDEKIKRFERFKEYLKKTDIQSKIELYNSSIQSIMGNNEKIVLLINLLNNLLANINIDFTKHNAIPGISGIKGGSKHQNKKSRSRPKLPKRRLSRRRQHFGGAEGDIANNSLSPPPPAQESREGASGESPVPEPEPEGASEESPEPPVPESEEASVEESPPEPEEASEGATGEGDSEESEGDSEKPEDTPEPEEATGEGDREEASVEGEGAPLSLSDQADNLNSLQSNLQQAASQGAFKGIAERKDDKASLETPGEGDKKVEGKGEGEGEGEGKGKGEGEGKGKGEGEGEGEGKGEGEGEGEEEGQGEGKGEEEGE